MSNPTRTVVLAALLTLTSFSRVLFGADATLLHCGTLIAIPGEKAQPRVSLLIVDAKVAMVIEGFVTPDQLPFEYEHVEIIDLKDKWVVPGLIEHHALKRILDELRLNMRIGRRHPADLTVLADAHRVTVGIAHLDLDLPVHDARHIRVAHLYPERPDRRTAAATWSKPIPHCRSASSETSIEIS